jgi:hypothetical protein
MKDMELMEDYKKKYGTNVIGELFLKIYKNLKI